MPLAPRQSSSGSDSTNQFLNLIADPFQTEIQANSIYAAIIWSFAVAGGLFLVFCFLRPRSPTIYAPRARHADEKHAPLPLDRKLFSWFHAIRDVKETTLVNQVGLDAVLFLRFLRMLRNLFITLTVFGCGILIPVNLAGGHEVYEQWGDVATLMKFTPQYIFGNKFWAFVVCAYIFQGIVCGFLWWNYRAVLRLRRAYFESPDYKNSLHSRTLLITHIPGPSRTDDGIADLVQEAKHVTETPRTAIARNVKELPKSIQRHDETVQKLEHVLAKYLKNPNNVPEKRPTCKIAKEDRGAHGTGEADAIDYLTDKIAKLEIEIRETREGVDKRSPMPYGFASYSRIDNAHAVAYACRNKGPGSTDVYLAPKPHDLLWQNLAMTRATRRNRIFWDSVWIVLLTIVFIVPNILTSVFLSDFSHLGLVWPSFQENLKSNPRGWGIAQGILGPLVQTLMYMGIPIVFRRLYTHSGDVSKTARERHVTSRLYAFFVFNNLVVFSIFGSAWRFVASILAAQDQGIWEAVRSSHLFSKVMTGLCNVSTFWLTWQMQRNLSAATDLAQLWPLVWHFIQRKLFSPTPRQLIELSAPQPFEYADYYNNFLFVATVGLCFGTLQPIILPITAFYMSIDVWFKKYLLQYVLITKTESGGRFWRLLVNRMLFAVMLANAVIVLVVGAQGVGSVESVRNGSMLYAMIPLPFLIIAFKWYCKRTFDEKLVYYNTQPFSDLEGRSGEGKVPRKDRVAVRFGHPALYKKLMTPMVHANSQHLLKEVYAHRSSEKHNIFEPEGHRKSTDRAAPQTPMGYSDMYMSEMDPHHLGKLDVNQAPNVEIVQESELDFENFKKRAEFREEFGGDGELYGRPEDLIDRPGTPSTMTTMNTMRDSGIEAFVKQRLDSRTASRVASSRNSSISRHEPPFTPVPMSPLDDDPIEPADGGTAYAHGYQRADRMQSINMDVNIPTTPLADEIAAENSRRRSERESMGTKMWNQWQELRKSSPVELEERRFRT